MNEYLQNLNKIEFAITMACTGRCRHCQNGDQSDASGHIDAAAAENAIRKVCEHYQISTVMTFGGEPLLYPEVVCRIHQTATSLGVGRRQVITNGYFSKDHSRITEVAGNLAESGVNDLLLSVDAFHQEIIPLEPVKDFAACAVKSGIPVILQPAWLVSLEDNNPYNIRTREILREFEPLGIGIGSGNVVFPSGNARIYLREYFDENVVESSPYFEDPKDVRTLSFEPNGNVLGGNIYEKDILEIIRSYRPSGGL